ncbi:MAG: NADP-dependent oxidoreductase [Ekhidna sp.]
MRKLVLNKSKAPEYGAKIINQRKPTCGLHEVIVKVSAVGLNPIDTKIAKGELALLLPFSTNKPNIGFEFSGVIQEIGAGVSHYKAGDKIFGRLPLHKGGAFVEYLVADEKWISKAPNNIDLKEAASIPQVGLTVIQGIERYTRLKTAKKVLIIGASGGAGSFAIQYCKNVLELHVSAICHSSAKEYVKYLGVDEIYYYDQGKSPKGSGYDIIIDCVGGKQTFKGIAKLNKRGAMISLAGPPVPSMIHGLNINWIRKLMLCPIFILNSIPPYVFSFIKSGRYIRFLTSNHPTQLQSLAELVEQNKIHTTVSEEFSLADFKAAFKRFNDSRVLGKVIIKVNE